MFMMASNTFTRKFEKGITFVSYLEDRVKDELTESSLGAISLGGTPFLGLGIEETISPKVSHELVYLTNAH